MALISEAFKNTYRRNFELVVQQRVSKLLSGVDVQTGIEKVAGERHFVDLLSVRNPTQNTGDPDSPDNPQDFVRRMLTMEDWDDGLVIQDFEIFRTLDDPSNRITTAMRRGFARQIDTTIIAALGGNAFSGHAGATTETLGTPNQVAVDYDDEGGSGNTNLTVAKLRGALSILEGFDVETDDIHIAAGPSQKQALLTDPNVTSIDFNSIRALINGQVDTFLGFKFHWLTRLDITGTVRTCFAWERTGLLCGFARTPTVEMDPKRADKSFNPYLYTSMTLGSTRLEEEKVVDIACDEA